MARKCSHCGHNGHNSRTCPDRGGVKLFGVRIREEGMRKSWSMGNLAMQNSDQSAGEAVVGYVSDGLLQMSRRERRKGVPWTEDEHRSFLVGLQKLGKGDWRGIAKKFVTTRTPTQVASHAQKYFIRQSNSNKRKRRSSLFDISPETDSEAVSTQQSPPRPVVKMEHVQQGIILPPLPPPVPKAAALSALDAVHVEDEEVDSKASMQRPRTSAAAAAVVFPPPQPQAAPLWLRLGPVAAPSLGYEIVKPRASLPSRQTRRELPLLELGMSMSSSTTLKLELEEPATRHSAFQSQSRIRVL